MIVWFNFEFVFGRTAFYLPSWMAAPEMTPMSHICKISPLSGEMSVPRPSSMSAPKTNPSRRTCCEFSWCSQQRSPGRTHTLRCENWLILRFLEDESHYAVSKVPVPVTELQALRIFSAQSVRTRLQQTAITWP